MKFLAFVAFVAFAFLLYHMNAEYEAAMAACQVEHSFDTCFYSLNH